MSKSLKEQAAIDRQERVMNGIKEQNARKLHNELRLGNWMKLKEPMGPAPEYAQVTQVYMSGFTCDYHWTGNWYEPIPLTPEVLEKCGFVKRTYNDEYLFSEHSQMWFKYYQHIESWNLEIDTSHEGNYETDIATIKYIHQLQNIYYALTGEELTYKP